MPPPLVVPFTPLVVSSTPALVPFGWPRNTPQAILLIPEFPLQQMSQRYQPMRLSKSKVRKKKVELIAYKGHVKIYTGA